MDILIADDDGASRAARDPLTRLWNHAEIFRMLGHELQRAAITPDGLVRAADAALYRAKRLGANRVEVASSPEQAHAAASA